MEDKSVTHYPASWRDGASDPAAQFVRKKHRASIVATTLMPCLSYRELEDMVESGDVRTGLAWWPLCEEELQGG